MKSAMCGHFKKHHKGMTFIELVIVLAILSILVLIAIPSYQGYMLRVHRGEAIRLLLQTAMCQERVHARTGSYDTGLCISADGQKHYQQTYTETGIREQTFTAVAIPRGAQRSDPCGSLFLNQSGYRSISATQVNVTECWNGR